MFGADSDSRTRTLTFAGGAVVLVLWGMTMLREDADPAPPTAAEITAECRRVLTELRPESREVPTERFEIRQKDELLRVYVSDIDEWISVCSSGPEGIRAGFGTRIEPGARDRISLFGDGDAALKAQLVLGRLPDGANAVEVRLPSGRTVPATHDGEFFALWEPDEPLPGAEVTATGPGNKVLGTATVES